MAHIIPIRTPNATILAQWYGGGAGWALNAKQTAVAIGWGNVATNRFDKICKRNAIPDYAFINGTRAILLNDLLENFDSLWTDLKRLKGCMSFLKCDLGENAQVVKNILMQFKDITVPPTELPTRIKELQGFFYQLEEDEEGCSAHENNTKLTWDDFNQAAQWLAERITTDTYGQTRGRLAFLREEKILLSLVVKKIFHAFYEGNINIDGEAILRQVANQCGLGKHAPNTALRALCKGITLSIPYFAKKFEMEDWHVAY